MLWKPYGTKMSVPDWSRGSDVQGGQLIFPYWHCHLVLLLICFPFSLLPHLILLCISHHVEWTVKDLWMLGESSISFLPRVPAGHGKTVTFDLLPASFTVTRLHWEPGTSWYGFRASMCHLTALSHMPPSLELSNAQRSHRVTEPMMMATLGLICTSMYWRPVKTPQTSLLKYLHRNFVEFREFTVVFNLEGGRNKSNSFWATVAIQVLIYLGLEGTYMLLHSYLSSNTQLWVGSNGWFKSWY